MSGPTPSPRTLRGLSIALLASLVLVRAPVLAQEATATAASPETTTTETTTTAPATETTPATTETAPASSEARPDTPPSPPEEMPAPIMVVVLPSGHAPEDVADAARAAVIAQVTPMTGGRPVLPLMAPALRDAIAACTGDAAPTCIGGQIAGAGAFGAILVRLSRRTTRGPTQLTLEMVDPVSGSPRLTPLTGTLADAASAAATLAPLTAQLQGVMFSPPPPPPTLLVTVNVDGARVRVDETELGESPVARTTLRHGRHVVQVTRAGYVSSRRTIELVDGQNERLDVILSPSTATFGDDAIAAPGTGGGGGTPITEEPLFWVAIGGGVLVIAGIAIGVGVAVANSGPPPNPMGIPLPPIEP